MQIENICEFFQIIAFCSNNLWGFLQTIPSKIKQASFQSENFPYTV